MAEKWRKGVLARACTGQGRFKETWAFCKQQVVFSPTLDSLGTTGGNVRGPSSGLSLSGQQQPVHIVAPFDPSVQL